MSFWDDHCPDPFEYEGDEEFEWGGRQPSLAPRCRHCGITCQWGERRGRWVLLSNLQPHRCFPSSADTDFEEE